MTQYIIPAKTQLYISPYDDDDFMPFTFANDIIVLEENVHNVTKCSNPECPCGHEVLVFEWDNEHYANVDANLCKTVN